MIKKGSLVQVRSSGDIGIAQSDVFTKRFMEAQDFEMEHYGLGDYAGSYTSAVTVLLTSTGKVMTYKLGNLVEQL